MSPGRTPREGVKNERLSERNDRLRKKGSLNVSDRSDRSDSRSKHHQTGRPIWTWHVTFSRPRRDRSPAERSERTSPGSVNPRKQVVLKNEVFKRPFGLEIPVSSSRPSGVRRFEDRRDLVESSFHFPHCTRTLAMASLVETAGHWVGHPVVTNVIGPCGWRQTCSVGLESWAA